MPIRKLRLRREQVMCVSSLALTNRFSVVVCYVPISLDKLQQIWLSVVGQPLQTISQFLPLGPGDRQL